MPVRLLKILAGLFFLAFVTIACDYYFGQDDKKIGSSELTINFFDVGQGDSALIKTPDGQKILVDGGPNGEVLRKLGNELSWWDRKIDLVILTHPHDDHVAGLVEVLKRYKVERIFFTGVVHTSPTYLEWLQIVKERKIPMVIIDRPQKVNIDDNLYMEIINPREKLAGKEVASLNDSSIVFRLNYGKTTFLFTGDVENKTEEVILRDVKDFSADVLKVAHHGSDTGTNEKFLNKVNPTYAVISVGKENKFGHPSLRTIKKLERIKAQILRTDERGDIVFKSDGKVIIISK